MAKHRDSRARRPSSWTARDLLTSACSRRALKGKPQSGGVELPISSRVPLRTASVSFNSSLRASKPSSSICRLSCRLRQELSSTWS